MFEVEIKDDVLLFVFDVEEEVDLEEKFEIVVKVC